MTVEDIKKFGFNDLSFSEMRKPIAELRSRNFWAPSNKTDAPPEYPSFPLGSLKISEVPENDPEDSYLYVLRVIPVKDIIPTEPEGFIRQHPTFLRYVEWYRQGHRPPYPCVFEAAYRVGLPYLSDNRRRILAAKEAGIDNLTCWFGPMNRETKLPLKYGDVLSVMRQKYSSSNGS